MSGAVPLPPICDFMMWTGTAFIIEVAEQKRTVFYIVFTMCGPQEHQAAMFQPLHAVNITMKQHARNPNKLVLRFKNVNSLSLRSEITALCCGRIIAWGSHISN